MPHSAPPDVQCSMHVLQRCQVDISCLGISAAHLKSSPLPSILTT